MNPMALHGVSGQRRDLLKKYKNELVEDSGRNPGVGLRGLGQPQGGVGLTVRLCWVAN